MYSLKSVDKYKIPHIILEELFKVGFVIFIFVTQEVHGNVRF